MDYESTLSHVLRKTLRAMRLTKILRPLVYGAGYEQRVDEALMSRVCEGDVVWDIGANVGLYSKKFADLTGNSGYVFAFEPHPDTFQTLQHETAGKNVKCLCLGLGDREGSVRFTDGEHSVTNRLVSDDFKGKTIEVEITTVDLAMRSHEVLCPTVVKIDVEGFELDVIRGMKETLKAQQLRYLMIEVHHKLSETRGISNSSRLIVNLLREAGFEINWVDPSHVEAIRS